MICIVLFLARVKLSQRPCLRVRIATPVLSGYMIDRELFELVSFELPIFEGQSYVLVGSMRVS